MGRNEIVKEKAIQIIEDFNNRDMQCVLTGNGELSTVYVICTLPEWMNTEDFVMDRGEQYWADDIISHYNNYQYEEDTEEDEDEIYDKIDMLTINNCKNSEFVISTIWEFDGSTMESYIGGTTDEELLNNILRDFAEYEIWVEKCKN